MRGKIMKKLFIILIIPFFILILNLRNMSYAGEIDKEIAISMATDNNYVLPTIVSMTSMLENIKQGTKYNYYILISGDFSEENKAKFSKLKEKYKDKLDINFIDMKDKYSTNRQIEQRITTPMYYRLHLPSILSKESKCIYIDCDTIVLKDLNLLYNVKIGDNYVAGVKAASPQLTGGMKLAYKLGIKSIDQYINSGVLLMNLDEMRKDGIESKFNKFMEDHNGCMDLGGPDQDTINAVCYNRILHLPLKYNFMTKYQKNNRNDYHKFKSIKNCYTKHEWLEARNDPIIIHYADSRKPWKDTDSKFLNEWWNYAKLSPLFKEIKDKYQSTFQYINKL